MCVCVFCTFIYGMCHQRAKAMIMILAPVKMDYGGTVFSLFISRSLNNFSYFQLQVRIMMENYVCNLKATCDTRSKFIFSFFVQYHIKIIRLFNAKANIVEEQ